MEYHFVVYFVVTLSHKDHFVVYDATKYLNDVPNMNWILDANRASNLLTPLQQSNPQKFEEWRQMRMADVITEGYDLMLSNSSEGDVLHTVLALTEDCHIGFADFDKLCGFGDLKWSVLVQMPTSWPHDSNKIGKWFMEKREKLQKKEQPQFLKKLNEKVDLHLNHQHKVKVVIEVKKLVWHLDAAKF